MLSNWPLPVVAKYRAQLCNLFDMNRFCRRSDAKLSEDILRFGFVLAVLLALAIGGISGFAQTLTSLLLVGVLFLIVGLAGWLVAVSRLVPTKKAACICLLGAAVTFMIWRALLPPAQWPAVNATLTRLTSPSTVTRCTYQYEYAGRPYTFETTREWAKNAGNKEPNPIRLDVFVNPSNPADFSRNQTPGWRPTSATLIKGETGKEGPYTGTVTFGSGFSTKSAMVSGPQLDALSVGSRIVVYTNPVNKGEVSLQPQQYNGSKNYTLLALSIGLLIAGAGLIAVRPKGWMTARSAQVPAAFSEPPQLTITTSRRLRQIDWFQFEKICERILRGQGWEVTRRGGANPDGGADLIARRENSTTVVQCKFWKKWAVAPKVMRELLGTKVSSGFTADSAMLFALQCSPDARQFARDNGMTVYEEPEIIGFIEQMGADNFPELTNPDQKECPKCGAVMVRRESARGAFWGCSQFGVSKCRGKIEIEAE